MRFVPEILRNRKRGQPCPPARAWRLVHLPEYKRGAFQNAGLLQLKQKLMPLARAFANSRENRDPRMPLNSRPDQLHDQHGLANAGPAEHGRLAAFDEWRQQIDDLDAGMKNLKGSSEPAKRGRCRMDRTPFRPAGKRGPPVVDLTDCVEKPAEYSLSDGYSNRHARWPDKHAAPKPRGVLQRDRSKDRGAKMLMDFGNKLAAWIGLDHDCFAGIR